MDPAKQRPPGVEDVEAWDAAKFVDERGDDLTSWEVEFLDSLLKQLKSGAWASKKQREVLERIVSERVK